MDSTFERFSFWAVVVGTFVVPVLFIVGIVIAAILSGSGEEGETIVGVVVSLMMLFYIVLMPVFCIVSSVLNERIHFKRLMEEERQLADMVYSDMKTLPPNWSIGKTFFVSENVVVANDYLKRFFWIFRKLVGGNSRSFEKMVERGRREVLVRLLKRAKQHGANVVWNIRMETTIVQLNSGGDNKTMAGIEMMAYGTAFLVNNK